MQLLSHSKINVLVTHPTIQAIEQPAVKYERKLQHIPLRQRQTGQRTKDTIQKESLRLAPVLKPLYASLDSAKEEIRVVQLHRGAGTDPLRCTIHHTSLLSKDRLKYESISYRWGKEYTTIEIDRVFSRVPTSAARVLQRMRHPGKDRLLWLDAICINQGDDTEKGFQVALMGKIYRNSSRNLIWLGDSEVDPLKLQKSLDAIVKDAYKKTKNFDAEMMDMAASATRDATVLDTSIDLGPFIDLFSSDWFHRVWIVQEAVLPPSNLCCIGSATVDFSKVLTASLWLERNRTIIPDDLNAVRGLSHATSLWYVMKSMHDHKFNLFSTFNLLKYCQATDPRDRIYGMLGLFKEQEPTLQIRDRLLQPDYQKPKGQVYRDATRAMIEDCRSLEVLHYVDRRHGTLGIPSWVVEFDLTTQRHCAPVCQSTPFNACDDVGFDRRPYQDKNILACEGFAVDIIKGRPVRIPGRAGLKDGSLARFLRMVKALMQAHHGVFEPEWARQMAFTLSAGMDCKHRAAASRHVDDFLTFMKYVGSGQRRPPESQDGRCFDKNNLEAGRWFHSFEKATVERRFFITASGFVGLGPQEAKEGDVVVVLFGGRVPHVLSFKRGWEFTFVGECYVDGMMYGEQLKKREGQEPERFYLV